MVTVYDKKLVLVCICFLALLFSATQASAAQPVKLRFANFPAAATFPCISMERWAKEVEKATSGAVQIETYPGGTLLNAKNMVRGVTRGLADIGCISIAYMPGAYPLLSAFELPLGFTSATEASAVMWDVHQKYRPAETSGFVVLAAFTSAPSRILSTRPLRDITDIKGMNIRASGVIADVVDLLGGLAVSMPQSDTHDALQKGIVNGVMTSLDVMQDYNFAESCRHVLNVDMPAYPFIFFMNAKKFNALPPETQEKLLAMGKEHSTWTGQYVDAHADEALVWSQEKYGTTVHTLSAEKTAALDELLAPLVTRWTAAADAKGIQAKAVLEDIKTLRALKQ